MKLFIVMVNSYGYPTLGTTFGISGEKIDPFSVFEEGVLVRPQKLEIVHHNGRHPPSIVPIDSPSHAYKLNESLAAGGIHNLNSHTFHQG